MLRNTPGFTAVAVLALALGIGANTAIFSVVNSVLLRPLPYPDADRMVVVWENNVATGWNRTGPAPPNYLDFRDQNRTFQDMCLFDHGSGTVTGFGEPEQVPGMRVTANFFDVFGAGVSLGRTFLPEEGRGGKHNVVIVSRNFWLRHFNGDPAAIGKRLMLDGLPYTIVGVLRADFWSPIPTELFAPWSDEDLRGFSRMAHDFTIVGRLKPGVPAARAIEDLAAIERRTAESFAPLKGWSVTVMPMQEALVGNLRAGLLVLLAAVGFVLLIACANLANLLLARSAARQRETALRIALGAGRARLVRQFLTESALLGLAGGGLGLLLALWGVDLLQHTVPMHIAVGEAPSNILRPDIVMDLRVLGFTLAVSLGTGLLFGILPALAASRADVNEGLKEGGRHTASASGLRLRNGLVVAETALALVLLIGAGLMIKSFWRMRQADPGFRPNNVLTVEMELPSDSKYRETAQQAEVFRRILERAERLPGVRAAALVNILPMDFAREARTAFTIDGEPPLAPGQFLSADFRVASPDFLTALGIPLVRGRAFTGHDDLTRPLVVLIDETAARRYFPDGANPIGRRLRAGKSVREIVGVIGAVRSSGLDKQPMPTVYLPFLQAARPRMSLAVRTAGDPLAMASAAKSAVYAVDKDQPVYNVRSMEQVAAEAEATPRFTLALLGVFAGVALLLAAMGLYGVISYAVSQRTAEIGVRMALGASGAAVLGMVLRQGIALVGAGVALGLAAAFALTRLLGSLLYGASATDPAVFAGTATVLAVVALFAAFVPAFRATRVDPIVSLRYE